MIELMIDRNERAYGDDYPSLGVDFKQKIFKMRCVGVL